MTMIIQPGVHIFDVEAELDASLGGSAGVRRERLLGEVVQFHIVMGLFSVTLI